MLEWIGHLLYWVLLLNIVIGTQLYLFFPRYGGDLKIDNLFASMKSFVVSALSKRAEKKATIETPAPVVVS